MKILVTGASGFIGSHIVPRLQALGHETVPLKNDLRDHELVTDEVLAIKPDIIVHLAARTEVEKSFYEQATFSDINYTGTVNLVEAASKLPDLQNFVFASTMEVYGWTPASDMIRDRVDEANVTESITSGRLVFDETTPVHPNAPYAVAKYACEKYIEYANRSLGLPYTIIRQTNAYGRKDNNYFVTEQIIYQMLTNSEVCNLGYGEPFRNFIYIDDLVDAWVTVIDQPDQVRNELFCLGPNNAIRISDYAQMIADKLGWQGEIVWNTKWPRPGEIFLLNSTNAKITAATGWAPQVDLNTGVDLTIATWKDIVQNDRPFLNDTRTFSPEKS